MSEDQLEGDTHPLTPSLKGGGNRCRILVKLVIFLLAGAIINVAVGWVYLFCLWELGGTRSSVESRPSAMEFLIVTRDETAVATLVMIERGASQSLVKLPNKQSEVNPWSNAPWWFDRRERSPEFDAALSSLKEETLTETRMHMAAGWPVRSMHCQLIRGVNKGGAALSAERQKGGLPFGDHTSWRKDVNVLPYVPLWPGFAINTIFYAAVVWGLFAVPGAIRRRVRRKRGQCAACGYSLRGRGSSGGKCTECGALIAGNK